MKHFLSLTFLLFLLSACTGTKPASTAQHKPNRNPKPLKTIYFTQQNGTFQATTLDKEPVPIGGQQAFFQVLGRSIVYPSAARQGGIKGVVYVRVTLNEFGKLTDSYVTKGIGYGCDEEALKAIRTAYAIGFEPAIYEDKPVLVEYEVPVFFRLAG